MNPPAEHHDQNGFAIAVAVFATAIALAWAGAVLAAVLAGHTPAGVPLHETGAALIALPRHLDDPAHAWPAEIAAQLPGPLLYWLAQAVVFAVGVALATAAWWMTRRVRGHGSSPNALGVAADAGFAQARQLRRLHVPAPTAGRVTIGYAGRSLLAGEAQASLAVIGPTGCGKTAGYAIPALLEWSGPIVATSVKADLIDTTIAHRRNRGRVWVYDPTGASGQATAAWNPLAGCATWSGALQTAAWMSEAAQPRLDTLADGDYWYTQARKALAPHLLAAAVDGRSLRDVIRWIDTQDPTEVHAGLARDIDRAADRTTWLDLRARVYSAGRAKLAERPEGPPPWIDAPIDQWPPPVVTAFDAVVNTEWDATTGTIPDDLLTPLTAARALWAKEPRLKGSVYATIENVLAGWADPNVTAAAEGDDPIDLRAWLAGDNTLYIVATTHEQARLRPVLTVLAQAAIRAGYDQANRNGGTLQDPCLALLDEAGNTAPLRDLPAYASTARSHGITLITIWQDLAQIKAIYHDRAQTVLNNHRAKLFGTGIADDATLDFVSRLIGDEARTEQNLSADLAGSRRTLSEHRTYRRAAPVDVLRRLRIGTGVLLYGSELPAVIRLRPWYRDRALRAIAAATTDARLPR